MFPAQVKRHLFDIEEYHRMAETGVLSEDGWVELIWGEVVEMTPIRVRYTDCVNQPVRLLTNLLSAEDYVVSVRNPLRLGDVGEPRVYPAEISLDPAKERIVFEEPIELRQLRLRLRAQLG